MKIFILYFLLLGVSVTIFESSPLHAAMKKFSTKPKGANLGLQRIDKFDLAANKPMDHDKKQLDISTKEFKYLFTYKENKNNAIHVLLKSVDDGSNSNTFNYFFVLIAQRKKDRILLEIETDDGLGGPVAISHELTPGDFNNDLNDANNVNGIQFEAEEVDFLKDCLGKLDPNLIEQNWAAFDKMKTDDLVKDENSLDTYKTVIKQPQPQPQTQVTHTAILEKIKKGEDITQQEMIPFFSNQKKEVKKLKEDLKLEKTGQKDQQKITDFENKIKEAKQLEEKMIVNSAKKDSYLKQYVEEDEMEPAERKQENRRFVKNIMKVKTAKEEVNMNANPKKDEIIETLNDVENYMKKKKEKNDQKKK